MTISKLLLILIIILLLAACASPAPSATATPLPPPPTSTSIPPTLAPPTPRPLPTDDVLAEALSHVRAASSYRVDLTMSAGGNIAALAGATPAASSTDRVTPLLTMNGAVLGDNMQFELQGPVTGFIGIPPTQLFEVILIGDTPYFKGPVPLIGANEEQWYQAPPQALQLFALPLTPTTFMDTFGEDGINPADFTPSGSEPLDGEVCTIYEGNRDAIINAFDQLDSVSGATPEDLNTLDAASLELWVCDDGYIHQVRLRVEGHEEETPTSQGTFEIFMRLTDFDTPITISAPPDAIPLRP